MPKFLKNSTFFKLLAIFSFCQFCNCQVDYSCEVKWVAEGYGNVPPFAIVPSPGEFISRVNIDEGSGKVWRISRLIPHNGVALVPILVPGGEHTLIESDTYEVGKN